MSASVSEGLGGNPFVPLMPMSAENDINAGEYAIMQIVD